MKLNEITKGESVEREEKEQAKYEKKWRARWEDNQESIEYWKSRKEVLQVGESDQLSNTNRSSKLETENTSWGLASQIFSIREVSVEWLDKSLTRKDLQENEW